MKLIRFSDQPEVPVSHDNPADPAVMKRVLLTARDEIKGTILMINWATLLPGRTVQSHAHRDMKEVFLMIGDGIEAVVNGQKIYLQRGDLLTVDAAETHEMKNTTQTPIEYLAMGVAQ